MWGCRWRCFRRWPAGLIVYDQPAIYVMIAVVVAVLHLVAMNLLYPKVVGRACI